MLNDFIILLIPFPEHDAADEYTEKFCYSGIMAVGLL